jgi:hypothetical protein
MTDTLSPSTSTSPSRPAARLALGAALALHLLAGWAYSVSGLVAPGWAVLSLGVVWLVLLAVLVRVWRRNPPLALLVPLLAAVLWFAALTAGEQLLGWTG